MHLFYFTLTDPRHYLKKYSMQYIYADINYSKFNLRFHLQKCTTLVSVNMWKHRNVGKGARITGKSFSWINWSRRHLHHIARVVSDAKVSVELQTLVCGWELQRRDDSNSKESSHTVLLLYTERNNVSFLNSDLCDTSPSMKFYALLWKCLSNKK